VSDISTRKAIDTTPNNDLDKKKSWGCYMKRAVAAVGLTVTLLCIAGCDDLAKEFGYQKSEPMKSQQPLPSSPTHRFIVYSHTVDIAFDTQTGQLCRTWDWSPVAPEAKPSATGGLPERKAGEFAPTCLSLFKQFPTTGNAAIGVVQEPSSQ
jgi:hypothetical protein